VYEGSRAEHYPARTDGSRRNLTGQGPRPSGATRRSCGDRYLARWYAAAYTVCDRVVAQGIVRYPQIDRCHPARERATV